MSLSPVIPLLSPKTTRCSTPPLDGFLSPRITAELDESLDLFLLGGDGNTSLPSSPIKSDVGRPRSDTLSSFIEPFITNAVHMEVQDNSRLPTFTLQVDRKQSSWQAPASRGRKRSRGGFNPSRSPSPKLNRADSILAIDEMLRLNEEDMGVQCEVDPIDTTTLPEEDMNLFEWFMDGEDRSSAALAYSFTQFDDMSISDYGGDYDGDGENSKAKGKHGDSKKLMHGANRQELNFPSKLHNSTSIPWRQYNRSKPLPIPTLDLSSSSPGGVSIKKGASVRFAASTNLPAVTNGAALSIQLRAPGSSTASKSNPQSLKSQAYSVAHSIPKASILHATVQRSKFGFGQQHKIPSVPGPPPKLKSTSAAHAISALRPPLPPRPPPSTNVAIKAGSSAFPLYKPLAPQLKQVNPQCPTHLPDSVGSVVAYERKKQRAKDARVRLNEAIDELAVAIDLAGSQSKERLNYMVKITNTRPDAIVSSSTTLTSTNPILPQHHLVKFFDNTVQQAGTAKKWDRPSFIGLSATIINSLNAQCESLMREVAQFRSTAKGKDDIESVNSCVMGNSKVVAEITPLSLGDPSSSRRRSSSPDKSNANTVEQFQLAVPELMMKSEEINSSVISNPASAYEERLANAMHSTVTSPNLLQHIASFMDPSSLGKCMKVSKRWRTQNIFNNTEIWLNMCIKRYGVSAVRKWQDTNHEDDMLTSKFANIVNFIMYRRMSELNIKPHSPMEGTQLLGGANSSDGLVSCWVSLMDRSNGETSRSVIQKVVKDGKTMISYLPIPVVELRLLIQNTGYSRGAIIVPDQQFTVDASTRRKGDKMLEVVSDERFKAQILNDEHSPSPLDGPDSPQLESLSHEMCHLRLFESVVISVHIHATGCSTTAKFCNRSRKIPLLYSIDGTTRLLTIPFHSNNTEDRIK